MENYLPIIVGAVGVLGTIIGVIVTGFTTEVRAWVEIRRQNKRQLKSLLFHQRELFGTMLSLDKEIHESYLKSMRDALGNLGVSIKLTEEVFGHVPIELSKLLETIKEDDINEVIRKHEETIQKLSEIDPTLAFNMSYRSRMHMPEQMKSFIVEMNKIASEKSEVVDDFANHIVNWQLSRTRKKLIDSLEKGIGEIAWRIGWLIWWTTRKEMLNWRAKVEDEINNEVKEYLLETIKFSWNNQEKLDKEIHKSLKKRKD